jgi:hypothetical protein
LSIPFLQANSIARRGIPAAYGKREIVQPFAALSAHTGPINVTATAHQRLRDDSTDAPEPASSIWPFCVNIQVLELLM